MFKPLHLIIDKSTHRLVVQSFKLFCAGSTIGLLLACQPKTEDKQKQLSLPSEEIYESLFLTTHGKDFPANREALITCTRSKDPNCFNTLKTVTDAVKHLESVPPETGFTLTMQAIREHCPDLINSSRKSQRICQGAFNAIYFYTEEHMQKDIVATLSSLELTDLEELFRVRASWYQNRSDISAWETLLIRPNAPAIFAIRLENLKLKNLTERGLALLNDAEKTK